MYILSKKRNEIVKIDISGRIFVRGGVVCCGKADEKPYYLGDYESKDTTDVIFEDGDRLETVSLEEIKKNGFTLSVNTYLQDNTPKEKIDIDDVNRTIVNCMIEKVKQTFESFQTIENTFGDGGYIQMLASELKEVLQKYAGN